MISFQIFQEANVSPQLFFRSILRGGPNDKTTMSIFTFANNDPLQSLAFFFRSNLARNAGVVHRRHVDEETSGERDVTGDTRALFADRLLGNLHQDFLTFFQEIADLRNLLIVAAAEAAWAATTTSTLAAAAVEAGTAGTLRVRGC